MNGCARILSLPMLWSLAAGIAAAQSPATPDPAPAQTAPAAAQAAPATTVTKPAKNGAQAQAQAEAGEPRANVDPAAAAAAPGAGAGRPPAHPAAKTPNAPNAVDRLELGAATVTGDREQPKVMYIVPWKRSDIGDMGGKPMNSLLDEVLAPVDREVFRRQVDYYGAIKADATQNGASAVSPANQGEK
jgi:hypothetical protein